METLKRNTGETAWNVFRVLSRDIHDLIARTSQLGLLDSSHRLQGYLQTLTTGNAHTQRIRLPVQQVELAEYVNVSPQQITELLKQLERDGVIRRSGDGWLVVNPSLLWNRERGGDESGFIGEFI